VGIKFRAASLMIAIVSAIGVSGLLASSAMAATPTNQTAAAPQAPAETIISVFPRDNCGGSNGIVEWQDGSHPFIGYHGTLWNNCRGWTSVWLSWDSPTHHNVNLGRAGFHQHVRVFYHTGTLLNPGHIGVTVCSTFPRWHCGQTVHV
jgi:hypothetical protein